jgi:hypothetical protein
MTIPPKGPAATGDPNHQGPSAKAQQTQDYSFGNRTDHPPEGKRSLPTSTTVCVAPEASCASANERMTDQVVQRIELVSVFPPTNTLNTLTCFTPVGANI